MTPPDLPAILDKLRADGWRIEPPVGVPDAPEAVDYKLHGPEKLLDAWRHRDKSGWPRDKGDYFRAASRFIRLGFPRVAVEMAEEGLGRWPDDPPLRYILGLGAARIGDPEKACRIAEELVIQGHEDVDTMALLGRAHKDLAILAAEPWRRTQHLQKAFDHYRDAFIAHRDPWPGINAAILAHIRNGPGDRIHSEEMAKTCLDLIDGNPNNDFWWSVITAEAHLLLGEKEKAFDFYRAAAQAGAGRYGDLNTIRRNADLILDSDDPGRDRDRSFMRKLLGIPGVAVFVGHMVDKAGRRVPRFPATMVDEVSEAVGEVVRRLDLRIGFSPLACGGDLLFHEAVRGLSNHELNAVLPYDREQFLKDSVAFAGPDWVARFDEAVKRSTEFIQVSGQRFDSPAIAIDYANQVMHGLASKRAAELDVPLTAVALWDGRPGDGRGGTDSMVQLWRKLGIEPEIIDIGKMLRAKHPEIVFPKDLPQPPAAPTPVRALLFADAVGFSKLTESQVPRFVQHFLGGVAALLKSRNIDDIVTNTWGDGLYVVFPTMREAGVFALDICDFVRSGNWARHQLPEGLNLRVALHAGPVYKCNDPVTGQPTYTGTHVSWAARIEPITPPGQVYASDAFAALAETEGVKEFTCDYVKLEALAKGYGTKPTYLVSRKRG